MTADDPVAAMLTQIADGSKPAFRQLYKDTSAKLFGVLIRILGQRAEAEDALQEVYTRIWLKAARFDATRGRGMTWIIAVARNHAIDRKRTRMAPETADAELAEAVADTTPRAETRLMAQGALRELNRCFDTLGPDQGQAVRGAYIAGLSYDELAARHAVPLNTVRTWLRRGLLKLRECMGQ